MPERIIEETDEYRDIETTSDDWTAGDPPAGSWRSVRREWKVANDVTRRATIDQAITDALVRLQELVDAPALPTVPDGTMTTAQLSNAVRQLRDHAQATRAGAQEVALTLKRTIRLVRGDFDGTD